MKAFIEYVTKSLVDFPEQVDVREVDGERAVVFEVRLNPADIGKVIGKSGRTITAIRTLMTTAAARNGKRAVIEIIEPPGGRRGPEAPATVATEAEVQAPPVSEPEQPQG
jgi:predicted RNA-binding protein YlqC (UPF0109 family)